jgi:hypothetical protein
MENPKTVSYQRYADALSRAFPETPLTLQQISTEWGVLGKLARELTDAQKRLDGLPKVTGADSQRQLEIAGPLEKKIAEHAAWFEVYRQLFQGDPMLQGDKLEQLNLGNGAVNTQNEGEIVPMRRQARGRGRPPGKRNNPKPLSSSQAAAVGKRRIVPNSRYQSNQPASSRTSDEMPSIEHLAEMDEDVIAIDDDENITTNQGIGGNRPGAAGRAMKASPTKSPVHKKGKHQVSKASSVLDLKIAVAVEKLQKESDAKQAAVIQSSYLANLAALQSSLSAARLTVTEITSSILNLREKNSSVCEDDPDFMVLRDQQRSAVAECGKLRQQIEELEKQQHGAQGSAIHAARVLPVTPALTGAPIPVHHPLNVSAISTARLPMQQGTVGQAFTTPIMPFSARAARPTVSFGGFGAVPGPSLQPSAMGCRVSAPFNKN